MLRVSCHIFGETSFSSRTNKRRKPIQNDGKCKHYICMCVNRVGHEVTDIRENLLRSG